MLRVCGEEEPWEGLHTISANEISLIGELLSPQLSQLYVKFVKFVDPFGDSREDEEYEDNNNEEDDDDEDDDDDEEEQDAEEQENTGLSQLQEELLEMNLAIKKLIKLLPNRCPRLHYFGLRIDMDRNSELHSVKSLLTSTLPQLQHLEHFTLNQELEIDGPLLAALGSIPRLRSLSAKSVIKPQNIEEGEDYGSFANLEELHLYHAGWDSSLPRAIGPTLLALRSITTCLKNLEEVKMMLEWISQTTSPVERMEVQLSGWNMLELIHFQGFGRIPTLRELHITFDKLDDRAIAALTQNLPNIRELHLTTPSSANWSVEDDSSMTLQALYHSSQTATPSFPCQST